MTIRIRFAKFGLMRFIGHLDVLRYFQKAIRRSDLDVAYSEGYHPHQIMSFASPLGMGISSDGEYVDIECNSIISVDDFITGLQSSMSEGFEIIDGCILSEPEENKKREAAMSLITCADYLIIFRSECNSFKDYAFLDSALSSLRLRESIDVMKKTKSGEEQLDIKPYIYSMEYDLEKFNRTDLVLSSNVNNTQHAIINTGDILLYLRLSAGSRMNIKPELVVNELYCEAGINASKYSYRQHRMELYMSREPFIPLINKER